MRDGRRTRASRTPRSCSSRTSRSRWAGSPSRSTSRRSRAGTCTSSAPPQEQLGAVAVACRRHANLHARRGDAREAAHDASSTSTRRRSWHPFRKEDCCLISDGGGAYIMTTPERARDLREARSSRSRASGSAPRRPARTGRSSRRSRRRRRCSPRPVAFAMAGLTPADVDVYTCYDPFTIVTLMQIEDSGFCEKGAGGAFVERRHAALRRAASSRPTPTAACSRTRTCSVSRTSSRSCASCGARPPRRSPTPRSAIYGGYTGPQAATLILRRAR